MNFIRSISTAGVAGSALALALALPASATSVSVNGTAVNFNPPPVERAGRVFVPLRGVFERLGASVVYANGQINATGNGHTVALRIGSTQANVNGALQTLDVAPFIIGASTFVPLRFVSQALGATVNYDAATRAIAINNNGQSGAMTSSVPPANHQGIAAGTSIYGTLSKDLDTATAQVGDAFSVNIVPPYPNDDARFNGAYVRGHVADVQKAGQGTKAQLGLAFDTIVFADGHTMPVAGHVTNVEQKHQSAIPQQAAGAAIGAIVGNIIGKTVFKAGGGGIAGGIGGFIYANNQKTNFIVPKSSAVTIQVETPRRQAGQ